MTYVIDASIGFKWLVDEQLSDKASEVSPQTHCHSSPASHTEHRDNMALSASVTLW